MLKVQVISREIVKPSSPTPPSLRSYKLTLLDQLFEPTYVPAIFFYSNDGDRVGSVERTRQLKKSLSQFLTHYYPVAGRLKHGDSMVECNDEGVEFSEAQIGCQLSDFLHQPCVEVLDLMVPRSHERAMSSSDVLLAVQITSFGCGGIAIGACIHHRVADATSLGSFMNGWANTLRGAGEALPPDFLPSKHFPTQGPLSVFHFIRKDNIVTKRFVFNAANIEALQGVQLIDSQARRPTRVEALSALIWRCIRRTQRQEQSSFALHAVNLRARMSPPLPEHSFGNLIVLAAATDTASESYRHMEHGLEGKLRDAIRRVDGNLIKELKNPDGLFRAVESLKSEITGVGWVTFTSWCRVPFYETDFGWGKPVWVSSCSFGIKNFVVLMGTKGGDGIEAWVNLEDVDMAAFELDEELLRFASI